MPTIAEVLQNSKPPLGATLEAGVRQLSADEELSFSLYQRYVFPLDGMVYWIKVPSSAGSVTTPGIQTMPGLASQTAQEDEAIQVSPGGVYSFVIVGGTIINPLNATDQGLVTAESLFVDFTGAAYSYVTGTTQELLPGESIEIPPQCQSGAWVCAPSKGHQFTVILQKSVPTVTLPTDIQVSGSFHYSSMSDQREDATVDSNTVIFTALSEVQAFNQVGPNYVYICTYGDLMFAFSSRGRFYAQADLYHYTGKALFSTQRSQVVDGIENFNPTLVVSNSLPVWLYMPMYVPPYPGFTCPIPLYPSYLVEDNLPVPFGSVHVEKTMPLGMAPYLGGHLQSDQLCRDTVRVHLYGADNLTANNFLLFVEQFSYDWMTIGMASSPVIQDIKDPQSELKIIAQRKIIEFSVNYLQSAVRDTARQFIEHVVVQNQFKWLTDTTTMSPLMMAIQENANATDQCSA